MVIGIEINCPEVITPKTRLVLKYAFGESVALVFQMLF